MYPRRWFFSRFISTLLFILFSSFRLGCFPFTYCACACGVEASTRADTQEIQYVVEMQQQIGRWYVGVSKMFLLWTWIGCARTNYHYHRFERVSSRQWCQKTIYHKGNNIVTAIFALTRNFRGKKILYENENLWLWHKTKLNYRWILRFFNKIHWFSNKFSLCAVMSNWKLQPHAPNNRFFEKLKVRKLHAVK